MSQELCHCEPSRREGELRKAQERLAWANGVAIRFYLLRRPYFFMERNRVKNQLRGGRFRFLPPLNNYPYLKRPKGSSPLDDPRGERTWSKFSSFFDYTSDSYSILFLKSDRITNIIPMLFTNFPISYTSFYLFCFTTDVLALIA